MQTQKGPPLNFKKWAARDGHQLTAALIVPVTKGFLSQAQELRELSARFGGDPVRGFAIQMVQAGAQEVFRRNLQRVAHRDQGFQAGYTGAALDMPQEGSGDTEPLGQLLLCKLLLTPQQPHALAKVSVVHVRVCVRHDSRLPQD